MYLISDSFDLFIYYQHQLLVLCTIVCPFPARQLMTSNCPEPVSYFAAV